MSCSSAVVLNAIKYLAGVEDHIHILSPSIIEPIINLKKHTLDDKNGALNLEEILMVLSISAVTNPVASLALSKLPLLKDSQAHATVILNNLEEQTFRKLGIEVTSDPIYPNEDLFFE